MRLLRCRCGPWSRRSQQFGLSHSSRRSRPASAERESSLRSSGASRPPHLVERRDAFMTQASDSPPPRQSRPQQSSSEHSSPRAAMEPQEAFAELSHLVVGEQPLGQVLARVAELAQACTPGAEEVSVTLLEGDKARSAAFTGRLAVNLDERQYGAGFGPCLDAAQSGQTIRVDDTTSDDTYPDFATTASRQGVRNTVSVGMPLPQRILG